ncbi:hypothetical protein KIW84_064351 [Lathyrus oleraceus]|uniref:Uncharacterized protein n=1 Tax=Pisum sativum TaxID=3888 RepID=A0A9D4WBG7_PEA|nr:hypothetical protein KIW84_064351 [Pisum sativum]
MENQESQVTMKAMRFSSSKNTFAPKLSIKLQEKNFLLWNQQVEGVNISHKLYKMVVNPHIPPMFKYESGRLENIVYEAYETYEECKTEPMDIYEVEGLLYVQEAQLDKCRQEFAAPSAIANVVQGTSHYHHASASSLVDPSFHGGHQNS